VPVERYSGVGSSPLPGTNQIFEQPITANLTHSGLASSGDYRRYMTVKSQRYGHILNPKTGWPVPGLRAVNVIGPQCLIAGSTYTIAMLLGDNGKDWLDDVGLPYLWFDADSRLYVSNDSSA
jgi:thiamine biosynthesis lipoprotein